ncbi:MAG TPA: hypothetical protein VF592_13410 [Sphingomonas sp.]|jgi:hypothetical protein|uniref:hypothetical protein n=1 Tax=Sphingomonas sp. TaxID=28214 RepID=UPI002ED9F190
MSLLAEINLYCRRTNMPPTRFGRLSVNDPRLVGDLARGRCPGRSIESRVKRFIERNGT